MVNALAVWIPWIGLLLVPLFAIASLWLWGGVPRGALGHLMAGALLLLAGAVFLYVPEINAFARMDNAYLGNALFGSYIVLLGLILLIGSLAGYGVPAWLAALLWLATAAFGVFGVYLLAGVSPTSLSEILLYAALVLGGVLLYISLRGYLAEAGVALAFTAGSFALVWRLSGGDLRAFTPVTIVDEQHFYKPPVLDIGPLLACLLLATILFFIGRFIQGRLRGQQSPADVK